MVGDDVLWASLGGDPHLFDLTEVLVSSQLWLVLVVVLLRVVNTLPWPHNRCAPGIICLGDVSYSIELALILKTGSRLCTNCRCMVGV